MLTKKQLELLVYLETKLAETRISPSFEEMKEALGLHSKSGIHRLICGLEERGFLRKLPHRARSIEILKSSSAVIPLSNKKSDPMLTLNTSKHAQIETRSIPLVGKIAAGSPIEAVKEGTDMIVLPESLLGKGKYFALTVLGESMIDIGIHEGDIAIIEERSEAASGDLVVALIDESNATLKRLKKTKHAIILESENKKYGPQIYKKGTEIRIQGILSGIIRKYR